MWRSLLVTTLKVLVAGGLLYYVLTNNINTDAKEKLRRIFADSPLALAGGVLALTSQLLIGTQRLRLLLAAQGIRLSYFHMLRLTYLGAFFDTFMVTSVGGDAIKAVYLARESPPGQRVEAVSVLVLDRFLGLLGLVTLMLVVTLSHVGVLWQNPVMKPHLLWIFLVPCLLYIGAGMLLSKTVYSLRFMRALWRILPGGRFIDRAYFSLQQFRGRPLLLLAAFGLSLCVHTVGILCGFFLLRGMGQAPEFIPFLVAWFVANFVCSFAPFSGIGVGQAAYNPIFETIAGVTNAWVLATAVQATYILTKAPGFVAWIISREQGFSKAGAAPHTEGRQGPPAAGWREPDH